MPIILTITWPILLPIHLRLAGSFNILSYDLVMSPETRKTKVRIRVKPSAITGGELCYLAYPLHR